MHIMLPTTARKPDVTHQACEGFALIPGENVSSTDAGRRCRGLERRLTVCALQEGGGWISDVNARALLDRSHDSEGGGGTFSL